MIKIYTSPSCSSCRKVKKWFEEQKIPYTEKNIFSSLLNEEELRASRKVLTAAAMTYVAALLTSLLTLLRLLILSGRRN